jgi:ribosomal protein L12E/L44/L45/RPP1/RPP2
VTSYGKKIQEQGREVEAAIQSLQQAGKELTREKLLEVVQKAPNDIQLSVMVSLARAGMDYNFFQLLSQKIDQAQGKQKEHLLELRTKLLDMTSMIDKQIEASVNRARTLLNTLLQAPNVKEMTMNNLPAVDEYFVQVFNEARDTARKNADLDKLARLSQIEEVLNQASTPPKEISLIEELLDAPDENSIREMLKQHQSELTAEFMEILSSLVVRLQEGENAELGERIQMLYRLALQVSMQANM